MEIKCCYQSIELKKLLYHLWSYNKDDCRNNGNKSANQSKQNIEQWDGKMEMLK